MKRLPTVEMFPDVTLRRIVSAPEDPMIRYRLEWPDPETGETKRTDLMPSEKQAWRWQDKIRGWYGIQPKLVKVKLDKDGNEVPPEER